MNTQPHIESPPPKPGQRRYLVIRTDNIGDLVCTTPLIHALRQNRPEAWIGVLANDYSAPVLAGNPDIDRVFIYKKAKHHPDDSRWRIYWHRLRLIHTLRRIGFDLAIIAAIESADAALRFARWSGAKRIVGPENQICGAHEVERIFSRAISEISLGLDRTVIPPCRVFADRERSTALLQNLPEGFSGRPLVGLHISARRPKQRLNAERFVDLAHRLHEHSGAAFLLFWSPGSEKHPHHPGDDEKAAYILSQCRDLPIHGVPTALLRSLIDAIGCCDRIICADGGAMHIAAGLGIPVICMFSDSIGSRWHPWQVPHRLLQSSTDNVNDISSSAFITAWDELNAEADLHPPLIGSDQDLTV